MTRETSPKSEKKCLLPVILNRNKTVKKLKIPRNNELQKKREMKKSS